MYVYVCVTCLLTADYRHVVAYFHVILAAIWYDTIEEFNVDSKAEYSALSSSRSQKKKLKQTTPVPL